MALIRRTRLFWRSLVPRCGAVGRDGTSRADSSGMQSFREARVVVRQEAAYAAECRCTDELMKQIGARYRRLARVLVIDGSGFRWEGLGNSGTRWMGLLRWGHATGYATFLRTGAPCDGAISTERGACRLDIGAYFRGRKGVDWHWSGKAEERVRAAFAARGETEHFLDYVCERDWPGGCQKARLEFANGTRIPLAEPAGMLRWFRESAPGWVRLRLAQQTSLEFSYSKPESLRRVLPLTKCPIEHIGDFRSREMALKCETFANMQPRRQLQAALLPVLRRLEPFDAVAGVHLRTGYADWQYYNRDSDFAGSVPAADSEARAGSGTGGGWVAHWAKLDGYLHDCSAGEQSGPCFNWEVPHWHRPPTTADARQCHILGTSPRFLLSGADAPDGALSALLSCAARLAEGAASLNARAPSARAAPHGPASQPKWGLLVLSDSPAFPSLARALPALGGRVVITDGAGQLGHSSYSRSCRAGAGCTHGTDPGGAWTRSLVDFYLAGCVDAFARALFTSFLWAAMRRNLLCCGPGAYVQWNAWYNLSRSSRHRAMDDRGFMDVLARTQPAPT